MWMALSASHLLPRWVWCLCFLLGNHLLILQCVQQTPLPGVEGWEPYTSLANHSPHTLCLQ